uniref:Fat storage inducing transmembrane protein 1 n=1 Tax=Calidris pygmaea TaxID=425635 RepID=A0A8C3J8M3_9CHAR
MGPGMIYGAGGGSMGEEAPVEMWGRALNPTPFLPPTPHKKKRAPLSPPHNSLPHKSQPHNRPLTHFFPLPHRRLVASAGGWTTLFLLALLVASLPFTRPTWGSLLRAVGRWGVAVALARSAPRLFAALEAATGHCWSPLAQGLLLLPHGDPRSCRGAGHRWEGFGASPQAFALVHCGLGLAEEAGALGRKPHGLGVSRGPGTALSLLFLLNVGLVVLWQLLLAVTLAYRHDWPRNAAGAALGWAAWALTYRCWYRLPWSPGPPGLGRLFFSPHKMRFLSLK